MRGATSHRYRSRLDCGSESQNVFGYLASASRNHSVLVGLMSIIMATDVPAHRTRIQWLPAREPTLNMMPVAPGIYGVYTCTCDKQAQTVSIVKLVCVGESGDIRTRVTRCIICQMSGRRSQKWVLLVTTFKEPLDKNRMNLLFAEAERKNSARRLRLHDDKGGQCSLSPMSASNDSAMAVNSSKADSNSSMISRARTSGAGRSAASVRESSFNHSKSRFALSRASSSS